MNYQIFKMDLEKTEEPEIKLPTSAGSLKKAREFQKNIYFCFIDYAKAFDCVYHNTLWKILKGMGIPDTWLPFWEICRQVRKEQLELDMEQQTGFQIFPRLLYKLGKEYVKAVYCHAAYLT